MRTITLVSLVVLLAFLAWPLFGATVTYNVSLSGVDSSGNSGDMLRVTGTVKADIVANTLLEHDLTFFLRDEPGVKPNSFSSTDAGFVWNATPQELRFVRTADPGGVAWTAHLGAKPVEEFSLLLQSGVNADHHMQYVFDDPGPDFVFNRVVLKPASGPDPPGFLFGTVVPEPSSLCMFGLASILLMTLLRHRPAAH